MLIARRSLKAIVMPLATSDRTWSIAPINMRVGLHILFAGLMLCVSIASPRAQTPQASSSEAALN
jgi:hypothetical protein